MIRVMSLLGIFYCQIWMYAVGAKALFHKKMKITWSPLVIGGFLCLLIEASARTSREQSGAVVLTYLLACALSIYFIEGNVGEKLITIISMLCVSSFISGVIELFLDHVLKNVKYSEDINDVIETLLIILIFLLFGRVLNWMKKKKEKIKDAIKVTVIVVVILMTISQGLMITGILRMREYIPQENMRIAFNIGSVLSFLSIAGMILFIIYIQVVNEKLNQVLGTERELKKMQERYYQVLLDREEDTRRYRHDMNNHLLCLYELSQKEKIDEFKDYIGEMRKDFSAIQRKCYATGNDLLDILLNYHLSNLEDTKVSVMGQCSETPAISNVDFCTIVSNLIQNAVEELNRQQEKEKYIKVKIQEGTSYLSITIKNSSPFVFDATNRTLTTVKKDKKNHGLGVENVRETVKKNGGSFELAGDGKEVTATVLLPKKVTVRQEK